MEIICAWHHLVALVMNVQLTDQMDVFRWSLNQHELFTVCSMYRAIAAKGVVPRNHIIWKSKLPLKIKICMWYLIKGIILTKVNLAKR